jgi:hypothetical protein
MKKQSVTPDSVRDMNYILNAVQMFQDHQITTKDMSMHLTGLRSGSAEAVVRYLETMTGPGDLTNKSTRSILHVIHPYMVGACQQALGLPCSANLPVEGSAVPTGVGRPRTTVKGVPVYNLARAGRKSAQGVPA